MRTMVKVRLSKQEGGIIDALLERGFYLNQADAVRDAIRHLGSERLGEVPVV